MKTVAQPENERGKDGSKMHFDIFTNCHKTKDNFWTPHTHTYFEITLLLEGGLTYRVEDHDPVVLRPGDVLFIPAHVVHDTFLSEEDPVPMRSLVVKFSPLFLYPMETTQSDIDCILLEPNFDQNCYFFPADDPIAKEFEVVMKKCLAEHESRSLGYEIALRGYFISLYMKLVRNCGITPRPLPKSHPHIKDDAAQQLHRILVYLQANYQYNISMQEAAEVCGISYYYFSRFFKKMTGKKFNEYLLEMRLNYAQKKLLQEGRSITDVSLECGFDYVSYFIRKFKEKNGLTPKEFRKKYSIPGHPEDDHLDEWLKQEKLELQEKNK